MQPTEDRSNTHASPRRQPSLRQRQRRESILETARIEIVMVPGVDDVDRVKAFRDLRVERLVPLISTDDVDAPAARLNHLEALARIAG